MKSREPLQFTEKSLGRRERVRMRPTEVAGEYVVEVAILHRKGGQWIVAASRTVPAQKLMDVYLDMEHVQQTTKDVRKHGKRLVRERGIAGLECINAACNVLDREVPEILETYKTTKAAFDSLLIQTSMELLEEARKRGVS